MWFLAWTRFSWWLARLSSTPVSGFLGNHRPYNLDPPHRVESSESLVQNSEVEFCLKLCTRDFENERKLIGNQIDVLWRFSGAGPDLGSLCVAETLHLMILFVQREGCEFFLTDDLEAGLREAGARSRQFLHRV